MIPPDCAVCDEPCRTEDDPHYDRTGHQQHPECCQRCRPTIRMNRAAR